jgi:FkbM family methyltransferase
MDKTEIYLNQYNFCKPYIKEFTTALDIGCDRLLWSKIMAPDFEFVHSFDFRKKHINLKDTPNITFHHTGLDEAPGIKYTKPGVGRIKASTEPRGTSQMPVPLRTLDSFDIKNIGFIKLDCDGYEEKILKGGTETIDKNDPVIFVEYNPTRCESHEYLLSLGYTLMDVWYLKGEPHDGVYVRE